MKFTIIGAGIGGLTTALAFEKNGIDYQIFERSNELTAVGAGIWLAPNALQVLELLGCYSEINHFGNSIDRITLAKADLTPISDNFQDTIKKQFGYSTIAIHRTNLLTTLYNQIPKSKIHFGKSFESFEKVDEEKIKITFKDDTHTTTNFLIGADGIHSKIRKQLFPQSEIRHSGQTCWRGLSDIKLTPEFQHRGLELWGDRIRFGMSRISEEQVYWFAVALDAPNQQDQNNLVQQKLLKMYHDFHPIVHQVISATSKEKIFRKDIIDLTPMNKWYKNNICLIGDAGHATTPNLGQGGAQAIVDAYTLSQLIMTNSINNVFEVFQNERQSKVNEIVRQSWSTGKMAHWKYGQNFRNFLLRNLPSRILEKKMIELYKI